MTEIKLRRFNEVGMEEFAKALKAIRSGRKMDMSGFVENAELTKEVAGKYSIQVRPLSDRFDAALHLDATVSSLPLASDEIRRDHGLWTWLSAAFFECLVPLKEGVRQGLNDSYRLIYDPSNFQRYYRHWLLGPWSVYDLHRSHPERTKVLLCTAVNAPGEIAENICANQTLVSSASIVEALYILYYDKSKQTFKRGAAGNSGGSVRRFVKVVKQFDLTWDLNGMRAKDIVDLLPTEFDRFSQ